MSGPVQQTTAAVSVLEVLALDSMRYLIHPTIRYLATQLTSLFPARAAWSLRYLDEIKAVLLFFVERHFLRHFGSSFTEHFYDLKRLTTTPAQSGEGQSGSFVPLTSVARSNSLFFMIIAPYIEAKVSKYFDQHNRVPRPLSRPLAELSLVDRFRRLFLTVYPKVRTLIELTDYCLKLGFALQLTQHHSLEMLISGLRLGRLSIDDHRAFQHREESERHGRFGQLQRASVVLRVILRGVFAVRTLSGYAFPMVLFVLSFLEWWSANSDKFRPNVYVPPPPTYAPRASGGVAIPQQNGICPLCSRPCVAPAVISSSGYSYCYACAHAHIKAHGCCPITLTPCSLSQLVRLYQYS
eukprot:m.157540 g.157540  ORF g.157540 m.157540 type:complete len:353 (+) comp52960_c0_seq4:21-1079(+)